MKNNKNLLSEETSILEVLKKENWLQEIKNEFQKIVQFSSKIKIEDFEDKKQIEIVKSIKQWYVTNRTTIKRAFKSKRDINTEENRLNLEAEREVLAVMETEEKRLWEMLEKADKMQLRKENEAKLKQRVQELEKYEYIEDVEVLLEMKDKEFDLLLSWKKELYLEKKEAELKAEQERIAREKELEEAKKQAKLEAEKEAQRLADIEKQRVEQEKRDLEDKVKREKEEAEKKRLEDLENARIEKENEIARIKKEQEEKELAEKKKREDEEKAKLEAEAKEKQEKELMEKRQKFIAYRDSLDFDHYEDKDWKRIFYKKVWEFII